MPRSQGIPLADVHDLAGPVRRTAIVRWALAVALVSTLLAAASLARVPGSSAVSLERGGRSGMVALDLSASIGNPNQRLRDPFEYLAATGQEFGLVVFSNVAYEAIPPGTASSELRGFLRALTPFPNLCIVSTSAPCAPGTRRVEFGSAEFQEIQRRSATPWAESFRAGTRISTGLQLARQVLDRHGQADRGVLLISDLDDSLLDLPDLVKELATYERREIPLHLVAISPYDDDRALFERLVGKEAFVDRADLAPSRLAGQRHRARAGVPEGLAGLALLLLMLLAANEHFCGRLAWRPPERMEGDG